MAQRYPVQWVHYNPVLCPRCRDQTLAGASTDSILLPESWDAYYQEVSEPAKNDDSNGNPKAARFSLHNLSAAFARLTGAADAQTTVADVAEGLDEPQESTTFASSETLSPRMIVEGMLFVGNSDGRPLTSREMAAHIRDVSPREVETLIDELNHQYEQIGTTYRIASEGQGFRFVLGTKFDALRQRFHGRVREAKLTPPAIEVLSVVAYRQPIGVDEVSKLRGGSSRALISQLVRRGLLRMERPENSPKKPVYFTTDRFNTLFQLSSLQDLPSSEDLDDH